MDNPFDVKLPSDGSLLSHLSHSIRVGPLPLAPAAGQPLPKKARRWLQVATGINSLRSLQACGKCSQKQNPREFLCSAGNLLDHKRHFTSWDIHAPRRNWLPQFALAGRVRSKVHRGCPQPRVEPNFNQLLQLCWKRCGYLFISRYSSLAGCFCTFYSKPVPESCNHSLLAVNGLVSLNSEDPLLKFSYRLSTFWISTCCRSEHVFCSCLPPTKLMFFPTLMEHLQHSVAITFAVWRQSAKLAQISFSSFIISWLEDSFFQRREHVFFLSFIS